LFLKLQLDTVVKKYLDDKDHLSFLKLSGVIMEKKHVALSFLLAVIIVVVYLTTQSSAFFWISFGVFVIGGFVALLAESDSAFGVINSTGVFLTFFMALTLLGSMSGIYESVTGKELFQEIPWNIIVVGFIMTVCTVFGQSYINKGYGDPR